MDMVIGHLKKSGRWLVEQLRNPLVVGVCVGLYLLAVVPQIVYPSNRALPFAKLDGVRLESTGSEYLSTYLQKEYGNKELVLKYPSGETKSTLAKAGVNTNAKQAQHDLTAYPLWKRLIPLSLLAGGIGTNVEVHGSIDKERFNEFAKTVAEKCYKAPKNAGVTIQDNKVVLDPAKPGMSCQPSTLLQQITAEPITKLGMQVQAKTQAEKPARSDKDVEAVIDSAQAIVDKKVSIIVGPRTYEVPAKDLASWLAFNEDLASKKLSIGVKKDQVEKFLTTAQKDIYIAPGTTVISTLDGIETARVTGAEGRGINMVTTIAAIERQVTGSSDGAVAATLSVLPAKVTYSRSYSPTSAGLQALLTDVTKDSGDFAISARLPNGTLVHANGAKTYHPASTYKMFVGWAVLKRIEVGQMQWSDQTVNGQTVAQCFDAMIVRSDNPCGEWFGEKIGWATVNSMLRGVGLTCTNLSSAWYSCANDQTLFLQKLQAGQLMNPASTTRLLDVMKRQIYRAGIPQGVKVAVADKVGFINGYLHDSGIVYGPSGAYELSIMSKGSSWGAIAAAAAKVQAQLNRM
ncbi:MAG: serine hydrolase [Candidatus Saccharimonadales bacterium]